MHHLTAVRMENLRAALYIKPIHISRLALQTMSEIYLCIVHPKEQEHNSNEVKPLSKHGLVLWAARRLPPLFG